MTIIRFALATVLVVSSLTASSADAGIFRRRCCDSPPCGSCPGPIGGATISELQLQIQQLQGTVTNLRERVQALEQRRP